MRTFEFTFRKTIEQSENVGRFGLDAITDVLFEIFEGDVVPALLGDDLVLACEVEAESLSSAVAQVAEALEEAARRMTPEADRAAGGALAPDRSLWLPAFRVEASVSDFAPA